jgi:hypothetical protein
MEAAIKPGEYDIIEDSRNYWLISFGICHRNFGTYNPICEKHSKLTSRIKSNLLLIIKTQTGFTKKENTAYFLDTIFINETDYHNRKLKQNYIHMN